MSFKQISNGIIRQANTRPKTDTGIPILQPLNFYSPSEVRKTPENIDVIFI